MNKYTVILEKIQKEYNGKSTPLDSLYLMGMCHAVQSIAFNDYTISNDIFKEIMLITQTIINEIIRKI